MGNNKQDNVLRSMIRENWQLVTDEPVECDKLPIILEELLEYAPI
jgi:hypothetical protein